MLKDGVVAEQGSHDELMQRNGVYAELYHIQFGTPAATPACSLRRLARDHEPESHHAHSLIVLPDDTAKPIVDALAAAKRSLNIRMFLFTDPTLLETVVAAQQRGVKVRVMLNPARRERRGRERGVAQDGSHAAGIEVRDSNPEFDLTHQKSMVIDDEIGFVESLNWETRDLTETRDYAVVTTNDARSGGDDRVLRRGLGAAEVRAAPGVAPHLVPEQRPRARRRIHRLGEAQRSGCRTSATRTR